MNRLLRTSSRVVHPASRKRNAFSVKISIHGCAWSSNLLDETGGLRDVSALLDATESRDDRMMSHLKDSCRNLLSSWFVLNVLSYTNARKKGGGMQVCACVCVC